MSVMLKTSMVKELILWRTDTTPGDAATVCLDMKTNNLFWHVGIYVDSGDMPLLTVYGGPMCKYEDCTEGMFQVIAYSLEKRGIFPDFVND